MQFNLKWIYSYVLNVQTQTVAVLHYFRFSINIVIRVGQVCVR